MNAATGGRVDRVAAFLAFKFGRRPSNALLEYMAEWGPNESLRREAARLLAKRVRRLS